MCLGFKALGFGMWGGAGGGGKGLLICVVRV